MKFPLENGYLAYDRIGTGIPLLFIHGYPLSRRIWGPQIKAISGVASVISVDLRGHGESYPYQSPYTMELLADDCKRLLDNLNIEYPIIVCGLSMGGYITFALFRKYPDLFRGMILTSTRAAPDSAESKANRDISIRNVLNHGVVFIAEGMLPKLLSPTTQQSIPNLVNTIREIMLKTSVNGVQGSLLGMRDRLDSMPLLPHIKCPALIIHGEDDQLIPIHEAIIMKHHIPNSSLMVIAKAGHLPNMEQPEKYNQAILGFIQSVTQE